jgi:hypothetical protein
MPEQPLHAAFRLYTSAESLVSRGFRANLNRIPAEIRDNKAFQPELSVFVRRSVLQFPRDSFSFSPFFLFCAVSQYTYSEAARA